MSSLIRKIKVESDGWLKVQAPEFENQEVDAIIVPRRLPGAEALTAWRHLCEEIQTSLARKTSPAKTSNTKLMIIAPGDECAGRY